MLFITKYINVLDCYYQMDFSKRGYGITFMDLDETLFRTFAKVHVVKNGKVIKSLSNSEFNNYALGEGESFEFTEFKDAKLFKETSVPIPRTLEMIKEMIQRIKETKSNSRIILLTARPDFPDKETFLQAFIDQGIDVSDKELFYIDRMGNQETGTVAERKRNAVLKYLKKGIYRRCRMIDDSKHNLNAFMEIANNLPEEITEKVRETYKLKLKENPIKFFALHIKENGELDILK
jgi:hypothetical protein